MLGIGNESSFIFDYPYFVKQDFYERFAANVVLEYIGFEIQSIREYVGFSDADKAAVYAQKAVELLYSAGVILLTISAAAFILTHKIVSYELVRDVKCLSVGNVSCLSLMNYTLERSLNV